MSRKSSVTSQTASQTDPQIEDIVFVGTDQLRGVVRFAGETEFASGPWLGLELDEPYGKNDGSVKGARYFQCRPSHGIFVRPTAVVKAGVDGMPAIEAAVETQDEASSVVESPQVAKSGIKESAMAEGMLAKCADTDSIPSTGSTKKKTKKIIKSKKTSRSEDPSECASECSGAPDLQQKRSSGAAFEASTARQNAARQALAEAVEEHDADKISQAIEHAQSVGVPMQELEGAQRILKFRLQRSLNEDVGGVRHEIADLARHVAEAQARAEEAERRAEEAERRRDETPATAEELEACFSESFYERLAVRLEQRIWTGLERRMDGVIGELVAAMSEEAGEVGELVQGADGSASEASEAGSSDWRDVFDQMRGDSEGLHEGSFKEALRLKFRSSSEAQRKELWKAYASGARRSIMDLNGFAAIAQAMRADPMGQRVAELAGRSIDEWHELGAYGIVTSRNSFVDTSFRARKRSGSLVTQAASAEAMAAAAVAAAAAAAEAVSAGDDEDEDEGEDEDEDEESEAQTDGSTATSPSKPGVRQETAASPDGDMNEARAAELGSAIPAKAAAAADDDDQDSATGHGFSERLSAQTTGTEGVTHEDEQDVKDSARRMEEASGMAEQRLSEAASKIQGATRKMLTRKSQSPKTIEEASELKDTPRDDAASMAASAMSTACTADHTPRDLKTPEHTPRADEEVGRPELVAKLFGQFDSAGQSNGRLGRAEMKEFATMCGFVGTASSWEAEYSALVAKYGWDPAGAGFFEFTNFVEDEDGSGYCSTQELQKMTSGRKYIRGFTALFDAMDVDHNGYVTKGELKDALEQGIKTEYKYLTVAAKDLTVELRPQKEEAPKEAY